MGIDRCWCLWSWYGYKFEGKCWAMLGRYQVHFNFLVRCRNQHLQVMPNASPTLLGRLLFHWKLRPVPIHPHSATDPDFTRYYNNIVMWRSAREFKNINRTPCDSHVHHKKVEMQLEWLRNYDCIYSRYIQDYVHMLYHAPLAPVVEEISGHHNWLRSY